MIEVKCTHCKTVMKMSPKHSDDATDVYLCILCGAKKQLPKKTQEQALKEEKFSKLDNERASQEGIMHVNSQSSDLKAEPKEEAHAKTVEAPAENHKIKKISSSKIKSLTKEISDLKEETNELKAKLEIKTFERDSTNKSIKEFADEFSKILAELNTAFNSRLKKLEDILTNLKRKIK